MKFKKLCLLVLCLNIANVFGQTLSNFNPIRFSEPDPKTPNVEGITRYIDFQSIGNSGVPDINIPIHEIKTKKLSLPISISYNAAGVKVADNAGSIGLGWNLMAGGLINRTIRGVKDNNSYWTNVNNPSFTPYNNLQNGLDFTGTVADFDMAVMLSDRTIDGAPDMYSYSLPSASGKFINIIDMGVRTIPKTGVKIENTTANADYPNDLNYKITLEDGTRYYFEKIEETNTGVGNDMDLSGMVYYLTKIESANSEDIIEFNYVSTYYEEASIAESQSYEMNHACVPNSDMSIAADYHLNTYANRTVYHGWQLSEITYNGGSIEFELDNNRQDQLSYASFNYVSKINKLKVKNSNGTVIKEIVFNYSYYNDSYNQGNIHLHKRLKLEGITTYGYLGAENNKYIFDYNSIPLPTRNSFAVDHWGYYNGKNNSTLIPSHPSETNYCTKDNAIICPCTQTPVYYSFTGADREVDPSYTQAGILNKITYPTGGSTEFEYENNETGPVTKYNFNNEFAATISQTHVENTGHVQESDQSDPFTILTLNPITTNGACGHINILYWYPPGTTPYELTQYKPVVELYEINPLTSDYDLIQTIYNVNGSQTSYGEDFTVMPGVSYSIKVYTKLFDSHITASLTFYNPIPYVVPDYTGGLRLKRKIVSEAATALPMVTKYEYNNGYSIPPFYSSVSSTFQLAPYYGVLPVIPPSSTCGLGAPEIDYNYGWTQDWVEMHFMNFNATINGKPSGINYREIKTIYGDNGENGTIVRHYETDNTTVQDAVQTWRVGKVVDEMVFNSSGVLLKKTENQYTSTANENFPGMSVHGDAIPGCGWPIMDPQMVFPRYFYYNDHPTTSLFFYQNQTKQTTYDQNGQNPVETITDFYYDNLQHYQPTRIVTTASDGTINTTRTKYAQDFTEPPAGQVMDATADAMRKMMLEKHMHSQPVATLQTLQKPGEVEKVIGGAITKYKDYHGFVLPAELLQLNLLQPQTYDANDIKLNFGNGSWYLHLRDYNPTEKFVTTRFFDNYDTHGNLLQTHLAGDTREAFVWSTAKDYPLAHFVNAATNDAVVGNECGFTGFEEEQTANGQFENNNYWSIIHANVVTLDAHTGNRCYNEVYDAQLNGVGVSRQFMPDNQTTRYKLSGWFKNADANCKLVMEAQSAGGSITNEVTMVQNGNSGWYYYEVIMDLGYIRAVPLGQHAVTLTCYVANRIGNNFYVDDLRFERCPSATTTNTFDPVFSNVSSQSDCRSVPTHFEYDNMGRMEWVRDLNKNDVKHFAYGYRDNSVANSYNYTIEDNLLNAGIARSAVTGHTAAATDVNSTFAYFDGLNRPMQTVQKQYSADYSGRDLVQPIIYDALGREVRKYLPYADGQVSDGSYRSNAVDETNYANCEQFNFYQNADKVAHSETPYAETVFEASPLKRVIEQGAHGDAWQPGQHTVTYTYGSNSANEIPLWRCQQPAGSGAIAKNAGGYLVYYNANELYKTTVTDENGHATAEFKDKQDKLICKLQQLDNDWLCTYYIYDDFSRLAYTLSPAAYQQLIVNSNAYSFDETAPVFNEQIFANHYDERGRLVEKKVPGKGWEYTVFDVLNQPVLNQSAQMADEKKWNFTKYDILGRTVITGIYNTASVVTRAAMQALVNNNQPIAFEERLYSIFNTNTNHGYSHLTYPDFTGNDCDVLTVNYYDNYDFGSGSGLGRPYVPYGQNIKSDLTNGLLTGANVRVLQSNYQFWLGTENFYDEKGRLIQQHKQSNLDWRPWDVTNNEYDFTGHVLKSVREHHKDNSNPALYITSRYNYDHVNRLVDIYKQVGTDPEIHLVYNTYNDIGQLTRKHLHYDWVWNEPYLQGIDYRYNIRGWLTSINNKELVADGDKNDDDNDVFGEELNYQSNENNLADFSEQYNGNIAATLWRSKAAGGSNPGFDRRPVHRYVYRYDALNRLAQAKYANNIFNSVDYADQPGLYNENMEYDLVGNLTALQRNSKLNNAATEVDNLTYIYPALSNKLAEVNDAALAAMANDFHGTHSGVDYDYNANGSLAHDYNKNLNFYYNHLDLVRAVTGPADLVYTYDATGRKLTKSCNGKVRQYVDGIEYENNVLQFIATEEGRIRPKGTNSINTTDFVYDYFIKDHLGNIRVVLSTEENDAKYEATMEQARAAVEEQLFENVPTTRYDKPAAMPADPVPASPTDDKVSKINELKPIGHAKVLQLAGGDEVSIDVKSFFANFAPQNTTVPPVTAVLQNLAGAFVPGYAAGTLNAEQLNLVNQTFLNNAGLTAFLSTVLGNPGQQALTKPQAFLTWIYFNDELKFIPEMSGVLQVQNENQLEDLAVLNLKPENNGYLYVYVSNESAHEVNFNNLVVQQHYGRVLEENHYYPYGLLIKPLSFASASMPLQGYKFNGKELENDLDLGWYHYGFREYDPVIGRFPAVDPLASHFPWMTDFQYASNNPVKNIDIDGLEGVPFFGIADILITNSAEYAVPKTIIENVTKAGGDVVSKSSETSRSAVPNETVKTGSRGGEGAGKNFTEKVKRESFTENVEKNGGKGKCEDCGVEILRGPKSEKGVPTPENQAQGDHIAPKNPSDGTIPGNNKPDNIQWLCPDCNLSKSNISPEQYYTPNSSAAAPTDATKTAAPQIELNLQPKKQ